MNKIKTVEIKENIYWTGVVDYDIKVFDIIMYTKYGTTYNSYIIKGKDKIALIDIAKETFFDQFIDAIKQVCDPSEIDYVIVNHTEPDHTGSLHGLLEINPNLEIIGSKVALKFLKDITNMTYKERIATDGDTLELGGKTLKFMAAPFLHWPDTMHTYCIEDKTLFPCDFFGCHYASDKVFNDLMGDDFMDAYKYYFDVIMGPFKSFALTALDNLDKIDIDMICPGHGPVLRTDIDKFKTLYREWATDIIPERPSIVIPYVSSYGYTKKLASKIREGIKEFGGIDVYLIDLGGEKPEFTMDKVYNATGILVGSPTLIGDTVPPVWHFLSELNPFIHKGKIAGVFGSYGWSGEAIGNIEERFKQLKMKMPVPSLRTIFNPDDKKCEEAKQFGKAFAAEVDKVYKKKYNK